VAHPSATRSLLEELTTATDRLRSRTAAPEGQRPEPSLRLLIGPEGGFDEAELARLTAGGATPVGLGPTILRIETAAEAGSSLAVQIGTTQSP
jgi:RsmE family RNA methyltransferase